MFRSILVPLDTSALSEQALPVALSVARRADAALQLAYVVQGHSGSYDATDAQARTYLEAWAERLRDAGCRATTVALLDGRDTDQDSVEVLPHDQLIARALHDHAAATGVDLVVMTTHSRGEVARLWLGSVAERLVRELSMPILLVRPRQPAPDLASERSIADRLLHISRLFGLHKTSSCAVSSASSSPTACSNGGRSSCDSAWVAASLSRARLSSMISHPLA